MTAIMNSYCNVPPRRLYVALELGWNTWNLGMSTGIGTPPRLRRITARRVDALLEEIARAKERFQLPPDAPVASCYEAGRDGFWLHRFLVAQRISNRVVDSASIEVNRRARRAKSDGLDVAKLLAMLIREDQGETDVWRIVRVPTPQDEDPRQLHREMQALHVENTLHINRIKGLLAGCGVALDVDGSLPERLAEARLWDDTALPIELHERLLREHVRWQLARRDLLDLENLRKRRIRCDDTPHVELVRRLLELRAIGTNSAWLFVHEFFGWREIRNRHELAALAGLTPTPYQSGNSDHEVTNKHDLPSLVRGTEATAGVLPCQYRALDGSPRPRFLNHKGAGQPLAQQKEHRVSRGNDPKIVPRRTRIEACLRVISRNERWPAPGDETWINQSKATKKERAIHPGSHCAPIPRSHRQT